VPSALVDEVRARLREIQAMLGTGPPVSPTAALSEVRDTLTDVSLAADRAWQRTRWVGEAGDGAAEFTRITVAAIDALAARTDHLGAVTARAADAVAEARGRLRAIVEEFEARAAALETRLDEPGAADELAEEARRALDEAMAVVDDLRAELDEQATAVRAPAGRTAATMPAAAIPGWSGGSGSSGGAASPGASLASGPSGSSGPSGHGLWSGADEHVPVAAEEQTDPGVFGSGVGVTLPDGTTATAPNAVAADAVRHALTQLGVPYHWGGTTPGVGLDCSGLTQWAYHEAGLDLPRLAQEQDVGATVSRGSLRPGDLAVWDGHVAMIVGDGLMIEAGDPVKLSPIRTTNAGQGFQGFWRPTA
jgi:cell wall-associated NlpC family hydrolase